MRMFFELAEFETIYIMYAYTEFGKLMTKRYICRFIHTHMHTMK